jgi:uncharacterized MnhB-related membrane protein
MTTGALEALQVVVLLLVGGAATLVVAVPGRVRPVLALSFYGLLLAVLFLVVQAPDVTLSELVVGAVALPLILLLTIAKVRDPAPAPGAAAPGPPDQAPPDQAPPGAGQPGQPPGAGGDGGQG